MPTPNDPTSDGCAEQRPDRWDGFDNANCPAPWACAAHGREIRAGRAHEIETELRTQLHPEEDAS